MKRAQWIAALGGGAAAALLMLAPLPARAHCDTLDGPVVKDARKALAQGDVAPALKWVRPGGEAEVRAAFEKARRVRKAGPEARELADRFFFETLVRVHRAGEGAPYTGLKPAGHVEPPIAEADRAIERGSVDVLARRAAADAAEGVRKRFTRVVAAKRHADDSVSAGRAYVAAYVDYVHYVEGLHAAAAGAAHEGHAAEEAPAPGEHAAGDPKTHTE